VVYEENERVLKLSDHFSKLVAKVAGYKSVKEYFFDSTISHRLKDIRVPTFFLNSLDDPLYGPHVIPIDCCYENILIAVTKTGGHICYFQGSILPTSQWFTEPAFEFLNYFIKH
jgi:predicted alpha/beta-fold hydrolase